MGEAWGEEAPAAVAAALPHYAQVKTILLGTEGYKLNYLSKGPIVKGFGRGSTELGFPTANFADEVDKFWNEERIIVFYSTGD